MVSYSGFGFKKIVQYIAVPLVLCHSAQIEVCLTNLAEYITEGCSLLKTSRNVCAFVSSLFMYLFYLLIVSGVFHEYHLQWSISLAFCDVEHIV